MAGKQRKHKGRQEVFWVDENLEEQAKAAQILDEYKRRNKNKSELIRRGIELAYYVDTENIEGLWELLPDSIRRQLIVEKEIERRIEVQPVIIEVKMPDYAPSQQPVPSRRQEVKLKGEFEVEDAPVDHSIGDNIDQAFEDLF